MKLDARDISVLHHIIRYCDEIKETVAKYQLTREKVESEYIYKNSLAMDVLQTRMISFRSRSIARGYFQKSRVFNAPAY
jgi:hypothetical protein